MQTIPNKGEHLIRYYGAYSNKARKGCGTTSVATLQANATPAGETAAGPQHPLPDPAIQKARRRWAMLIQKVYEADPLLCPQCGGTMKIISFIEARQADVLRKILEHCGLWENPPPPRAPPASAADPDAKRSFEADGDFEEHRRREQAREQAGQLAFDY